MLMPHPYFGLVQIFCARPNINLHIVPFPNFCGRPKDDFKSVNSIFVPVKKSLEQDAGFRNREHLEDNKLIKGGIHDYLGPI